MVLLICHVLMQLNVLFVIKSNGLQTAAVLRTKEAAAAAAEPK
jgi:hypothetical protein